MNNVWSRGFSPENKHRHLPHIDIKDHYQFITFRTQDSVDTYLRKLARQNLPNSKQQLAIDKYLDQSQNGAYLTDEVLLFLSDFIKMNNTVLYELIAFCIMPNQRVGIPTFRGKHQPFSDWPGVGKFFAGRQFYRLSNRWDFSSFHER